MLQSTVKMARKKRIAWSKKEEIAQLKRVEFMLQLF